MRVGICSRCKKEKELVKSTWCRQCKNAYERDRISKQSKEKKEELRKRAKERYKKKRERNIKNLETIFSKFNLDDEKVCTKCNEKRK